MKKEEITAKHQGISMPMFFVDEIKEHLMGKKRHISIAEFTREAVKEKIARDNQTKLEKALDSIKAVADKDVIEELRRLRFHRHPVYVQIQEAMAEYEKYREDVQKQKEEWDKANLEYQYSHGTPSEVKDLKKRMKKKHKKDGRELPSFLSDEQKVEVIAFVEKMLEKKDKKKLA